MRISGGIFNLNQEKNTEDIHDFILHNFDCIEKQQVKVHKQATLCLFAATNEVYCISPTTIFIEKESGLVVSGEIRLYNRDELKVHLSDNKSIDFDCNHQVVLALYKKFNHHLLTYLNGDFSFVIWDENKQELFCARDQMGQKPFFYSLDQNKFIYSTHINAVCLHETVSKELDDVWVLDYLQKKISYTDKTVYQSVKRLKPAHYLVVSAEKIVEKCYWRLEDVAPNSAKTLEEAIQGLKTHIEWAVRIRIEGSKKIGAELSGGLDSSAVASIAQTISKSQNFGINTYTNALAEDQKFTFENFVDEWDKASEVAKFSGIENHIAITEPAKPILDLIRYEIDTLGYPTNFSFTSLQLGIFLKSKEQGDEILLSGFGGDELVTEGALGRYPYTLVKNKKLKELQHFFKEQKGQLKGTLYTIYFLLCFILNREQKRNKTLGKERWKNVLINDDLVYKHDLKEKYILDFYFPPNQTLRERSLYRIYLPGTVERIETGYAITNSLGLEYNYPLLDVNLLEYYFSLPDEWKAHPKLSRFLFRKAMHDYFPAEILKQAKPTNTATIPFAKTMFKNQIEALEKEANNFEGLIYTYLNKTKLKNFIKKDAGSFSNFKFNFLKNSIMFYIFLKKNLYLQKKRYE